MRTVDNLIKTNEQGFSAVEVLLTSIVIIGLATIAGLASNRQAADQTNRMSPNTVHLSTLPDPTSTTPTNTTLELESLGISITVPNSINDLTYAAPDRTGGYGLSTKTLTALDAGCTATSSEPPLGDFFRSNGQYSTNNTGPGQLLRQFTGFYIAWSPSPEVCSTLPNVQTLIHQQQLELEDSFKTIEQATPATTGD